MLQAMEFGNIPVVDYLLSKDADPSFRSRGRSIFRAIARVSIDGDLADPVPQVRRFIEMGLKPDFEDILSILGFLADGEPDDSEALGDCLKEIVAGAQFGKEVLPDLDTDDISEKIEDALGNAPETTTTLLELLKARGVDLEALGTSAEA